MRFQILTFALLASLARSTFVDPPESNNGKDDFKKTYTVNDKITIKFSSSGWDQYKSDLMDLWVVSYKSDAYSSRISKKQNITSSRDASIDWTVNIPADKIKGGDQFVLQFKKAVDDDIYDSKSLALNSAGFTVRSASSSSSSGTSKSKTKSSKKKNKKGKVKVGTIVGIVIGVLIGIAVLCVIALVVLKKAKEKKAESATAAEKVEEGGAGNPSAPMLGQETAYK